MVAPTGSLRFAGVVLAVALLGAWRSSFVLPGLTEGSLTPFRGQAVVLRGTVVDPPRCRAMSCLFVLRVNELEAGGRVHRLEGQAQVRTNAGADPVYGRSVLVRGELRGVSATVGFPQVELLARRGIHEVMDYPVVRTGDLVDLEPRGRLEQLRAWLEERLVDSVPGTEGQLAAGLLLGRDVALSQEVRTQLQTTGTSHILAVSGFNVALVGGAVIGLAARPLGRQWSVVIACLIVAAYALLVGAPPSAVRAAIMFGAIGLASIVGRLPDTLSCLVLAGSVMAALEPAALLDLGFQLSFTATAGLVLLGKRLTPASRRLPRALANALGLTLAAQIMTLPLVLHTFHSISLVAPLTNVLVGLALPPLLGSAVFALTLGWLPGLGWILGGPVWLLSHYVLLVVGWTAGLPGASFATGSLPLWALLAAYFFILAPIGLAHLSTRFGHRRSLVWRGSLLLALAGLILVGHWASLRERSGVALRALFFDTAGGGLTLLETGSGRRVLVGSAPSPLIAAAVAEQLPLLDRSIDLLVVSDAGEGELNGLAEIVRRYPVGLVLQPEAIRGDSSSRWTSLLQERGVPTVAASPGLVIDLDGQAQLQVDEVVERQDVHMPSLNVRVLFGKLDLRVAAGPIRAGVHDENTVVVRLAPGLGLGAELRRQMGTVSERAVVVGGRNVVADGTGLEALGLAGGEIVELTSDGSRTHLQRTRCRSAPEPCSWPP